MTYIPNPNAQMGNERRVSKYNKVKEKIQGDRQNRVYPVDFAIGQGT